MSFQEVVWDEERAYELARTAYRYVARVYPKDAPLEPLVRADAVAFDAQEAGDWQAYEDALRELCRGARREVLYRANAEIVVNEEVS